MGINPAPNGFGIHPNDLLYTSQLTSIDKHLRHTFPQMPFTLQYCMLAEEQFA